MSTLTFELTLPAKLKKKPKYWVSSCPALDVVSQGLTKEEAKENLVKALTLFLASYFERGTLEQALKECGFSVTPAPHRPPKADKSDFVKVPLYLLSQSRRASQCPA